MSYIRPEVYVPPESGALLCPDCHATYHAQFRDDPCVCSPSGPVHDSASDCPCDCAVEAYATPGDTCDACDAWYADGEWQTGDPHDTALWAWSRCDRCNAQTPHPASDRTPVPQDCGQCSARGAVTFPGPWRVAPGDAPICEGCDAGDPTSLFPFHLNPSTGACAECGTLYAEAQ